MRKVDAIVKTESGIFDVITSGPNSSGGSGGTGGGGEETNISRVEHLTSPIKTDFPFPAIAGVNEVVLEGLEYNLDGATVDPNDRNSVLRRVAHCELYLTIEQGTPGGTGGVGSATYYNLQLDFEPDTVGNDILIAGGLAQSQTLDLYDPNLPPSDRTKRPATHKFEFYFYGSTELIEKIVLTPIFRFVYQGAGDMKILNSHWLIHQWFEKSPKEDTTPLLVVSSDPFDGQQDIEELDIISITFNQPVNFRGDAIGWTRILVQNLTTRASYHYNQNEITINGNTITFPFKQELWSEGAEYRISVIANNFIGSNGQTNKGTGIVFKTASSSLEVISTTPYSNEIMDLFVDTPRFMIITFNQNIDFVDNLVDDSIVVIIKSDEHTISVPKNNVIIEDNLIKIPINSTQTMTDRLFSSSEYTVVLSEFVVQGNTGQSNEEYTFNFKTIERYFLSSLATAATSPASAMHVWKITFTNTYLRPHYKEIDINDWQALADIAPLIRECSGHIALKWGAVDNITINFENLLRTGADFFRESGFNGELLVPLLWFVAGSFMHSSTRSKGLSFPSLTNTFNPSFMFEMRDIGSTDASNPEVITFGKTLSANWIAFLRSQVASTRFIKVRFLAPQTVSAFPTGTQTPFVGRLNSADLEIHKDSVGVNVANRTWNGLTFRSIRLLNDDGSYV
jgi:hypothetical protein